MSLLRLQFSLPFCFPLLVLLTDPPGLPHVTFAPPSSTHPVLFRVPHLLEALLGEEIIDLAVLAAEVEQQSPLLLEHGAAQVALEPRHHLLELRGEILHEVSAVVLLQLSLGGEGLVADLAHLVVTLVTCAVYASVFTAWRSHT